MIGQGTRIHFMGIGGIGMSGLATVCRERGALVSGCDAKPNELIRRLQAHGASIHLGHHPDHLKEPVEPPGQALGSTMSSFDSLCPSTRPAASLRTVPSVVEGRSLTSCRARHSVRGRTTPRHIGGDIPSEAPHGLPRLRSGQVGRGPSRGVDVVVYSAAVSEAEPELRAARRLGLPVSSRGAFLAELAADRLLVAVAGAHGKTTTSGMASQLLLQAGWDPTVIVGGLMRSLGTNARSGAGSYLVAETDESDGSFLHLAPSTAIVTNIDREHLNHYRTFDRLVEAFQQFVGQLKPWGRLIRCTDDPLIRRLLSHPRQLSYGLNPDAEVTAERVTFTDGGSRFRAVYNGRPLGTWTLQVPGRHNVLNALAVISLGLTLDIPLLTIRQALAAFQGTGRRFQLVELPGDIRLIEDYAHHPAEIRATLCADATVGRHRLAVFQPHRFSRTQSLEDEFAMCFDRADAVIVTDIYPAFEAPIPGVSGERLAHLIRGHGHRWVRYVPKQELTAFVSRIALPGDTIFFLGAGDITEVCHELAQRLHAPAGAAG